MLVVYLNLLLLFYSIILYFELADHFYPACTFLSCPFSSNKTKSVFTPWKLRSIKKSKYLFRLSVETFGWYLFELIVLLKPDFNFYGSFTLSWVTKGT